MMTPDERWADDSIQFPRLLCEIDACCDIAPEDMFALCDSMDLSLVEINELFERAHRAWERIKAGVT